MQDPNKAYDHFAAHYTRFMFTYIKVGYDYNTRFFISVSRPALESIGDSTIDISMNDNKFYRTEGRV
jgi:hypothetical protein